VQKESELILYQTDDGVAKVEARLQDDNVWLTQGQIQELYGKGKATVGEHIKHIFEEGELSKEVVVRNFRTTTQHGAIEGKIRLGDLDKLKVEHISIIIAEKELDEEATVRNFRTVQIEGAPR
jgi:hypothetical protein